VVHEHAMPGLSIWTAWTALCWCACGGTAVERIARSLERGGQVVPCVAVADPPVEVLHGGERLVLIDGYRRIDALRRLGRDTARMWPRRCSASWRGVKAVIGGDRRSAAGS
jgi:hypothetical protein